MFDLQFEVVGAVLDAAYAFLVCQTGKDSVYDSGNIRQPATASARCHLSISDRACVHKSARRLIGLLRFVLDDVYPHWTVAPPEIFALPHYSPERTELVHRWVQSYSLYNCAMLHILRFNVLENKQQALDESGTLSTGTQKFDQAQKAARAFLTARIILSQLPSELDVPLDWPSHPTARVSTLINGCTCALWLDSDARERRRLVVDVSAARDGYQLWSQMLCTKFLEPVAICFQELKADAKACIALQIAFDNGNLFVFDDMDSIYKTIKHICSLPDHAQLYGEITDTFLPLGANDQNYHGSSPWENQPSLVFS